MIRACFLAGAHHNVSGRTYNLYCWSYNTSFSINAYRPLIFNVRGSFLSQKVGLGILEVKLIGRMLLLMEEDDCFGSQVIDSGLRGSLHHEIVTFFRERWR